MRTCVSLQYLSSVLFTNNEGITVTADVTFILLAYILTSLSAALSQVSLGKRLSMQTSSTPIASPTAAVVNNQDDNDWGSYFSAKKAKLNEQFNTSKNLNEYKQIFEGVTIYINGYTDPPLPELREIFTNHGGHYHQYFNTRTTFVIATNLPVAKKRLMSKKALKPEWITESVSSGVKLDHRKYLLYNPNEEQNQKTLTQISTNPRFSEAQDSRKETESSALSILSLMETEASSSSAGGGRPDSLKSSSLKSTTEDGFLEEFYNNSRLHLISTMKKHTQQLVARWRSDSMNHEFTRLSRYMSEAKEFPEPESDKLLQHTKPVIFHIDLDCFFVAVGRLTRPHLIDLPVAVTHSKGTKAGSKSEIACVSYEGRAKGVYAGMWLDEAKRLCPELQTIPYEFDEYKRISTTFFETVASLTLDIEPISCDELYLNATKLLADSGSTAEHLGQFLRNAIKDSTKISCSIGIGGTKLSARIGTSQAKEKGLGIRKLTESELKAHLQTLPVRKLPGVGYSTTEKLHELYKTETCGDLQQVALAELKQALGDKTGEKLYWLSRGIDNDLVNCDNVTHLAKSISAGCSFGVRFTSFIEVNTFVKQLSVELSKRATESQCFGKKITLSLWIVKKGHIDDIIKPGAHGQVDVHSRTRPFHILTRDSTVISKMSSELVRSITKTSIAPNYIRGIRISLDNLRYEFEMTSTEKKSTQRTIDSSFTLSEKDRDKSNEAAIGQHEHDTSQSEFQNTSQMTPATFVKKAEPAVVDVDSDPDITIILEATGYAEANPQNSKVTRILPAERNELPFLNGVNQLADIKCIISGGIKLKKSPCPEDGEVLTTYLQDLVESNHVDEGVEFINYILELIPDLQKESNELNLSWISSFVRILRDSETIICQKYGEQNE